MFISELEDFDNTMQELKLQSSYIYDFESAKSFEGSQENLELENFSVTIIQNQIEAQYNDLLHMTKKRRKKLNESTKTHILLREGNEHAIIVEKVTKNSEVRMMFLVIFLK